MLAEVADDHVTGTALPAAPGEATVVTVWREVEVELVDGDETALAALTEAVVAAGARPADSPSKLSRVIADRLAAVDGPPVPAAAVPPAAEPPQGKGGRERRRRAGGPIRSGRRPRPPARSSAPRSPCRCGPCRTPT